MAREIKVSKILIQDEEGRFLMLKKAGHYDFMADKWEQPGGKLEGDEDRFEAARREVRTETGLEIESFEDLVRLEIEDDELINCYVLFADEFSGEIQLSEEHQDYRWVSKEEALELDWHRNAAYILPVIECLENYRDGSKDYCSGEHIDVVKLLIRNDEGKFLAMQKTAEDKVSSGEKYTLYGRMAGKWELPGGRFKGSSNRFEAAKREIEEECGIRIKNIKDVVREEIEEINSVNTHILFTDDWNGEIELSKEHQDFKWVRPEEYLHMDWHPDAGYGYPPMKHLDEYID